MYRIAICPCVCLASAGRKIWYHPCILFSEIGWGKPALRPKGALKMIQMKVCCLAFSRTTGKWNSGCCLASCLWFTGFSCVLDYKSFGIFFGKRQRYCADYRLSPRPLFIHENKDKSLKQDVEHCFRRIWFNPYFVFFLNLTALLGSESQLAFGVLAHSLK